METGRIRNNRTNCSAAIAKMTVSLLASLFIIIAIIIASPSAYAAYVESFDELYPDVIENQDGSLTVSGGEGLIKLSNVSPDMYQQKTINIRLTSNDSNFHDMRGEYDGFVFQGLGTDEYPFSGTIAYLSGSKVPFIADRAMFNVISTGAVLDGGIEFVPYTGSDEPVLAGKVTATATDASWAVTYKLDGVTAPTEHYCNGGLIGIVGEDAALAIDFSSDGFESYTTDIESTGNAGFIAGTVSEGASVTVDMNGGIPTACVSAEYCAGLIAGRVDGTLTVTDFPSSVSSSFSISSGNASGLAVGYINENAQVSISGNVSSAASVSASGSNGAAGGVAGYVDEGASLTLSGNWSVAGSVSTSGAGSYAGGAVGCLEKGTVNVGSLTVSTSVTAGGNSSFCGGFIGSAEYDSDTVLDMSKIIVSGTTIGGSGASNAGGLFARLTVSGTGTDISITATDSQNEVSTTYTNPTGDASYGGLIGRYSSQDLSNSLTVSGVEISSDLSVGSSNQYYYNKNYGGVIADLLDDNAFIKIDDISVDTYIGNGDQGCPRTYGGIVANGISSVSGNYGLIDIGNVTLTARSAGVGRRATNSVCYGGLVGKSGSLAVRLSGTTDLSDAWPFRPGYGLRTSALLVGDNTGALVYACGDGNGTGWTLIRPDSTASECSDLGVYGEVIRMTSAMPESDVLTYDTSAHTLTLKTVSYTLSSPADFAVYAIASDCSPATSGALRVSAADASQNISMGSDINLTGTGLTSLSYRKTFTGTLDGGSHTLTLATGEIYGKRSGATIAADTPSSGQIYYQEKSGLFADLGGTVQNLSLAGTMDLIAVENAGAVAATCGQTSVSISGCSTSVSIKDTYADGYYFSDNSYTTVTWDHYVGGVIGRARNTALSVNGLALSGSLTVANPKDRIAGAGGLLANTLENCDVTLSGITVSGASVDTGSLTFGALVHDATGRMHVVKNGSGVGIKYTGSSSTLSGTTRSSEASSLVVGDGSGLYFILDKDAFSVDAQPAITLTGGTYFDELVGMSKSSGNNGIVTIETDNKGHLDESSVTTYVKQLTNQYDNPNTRYYYDIYAICGNSGIAVGADHITDAEEMMAYSVRRYAASGLGGYFLTDPSNAFTVTGTIDLSGYSYYPIDASEYFSIQDATIILDYSRYHTAEASNRMPDDNQKQHHLMHSAVFNDVPYSMTVSNLTMGGTAGYVDGASGALIRGTVSGSYTEQNKLRITDLVLDDLSIVYTGGAPDSYPLLINHIGSYVTFDLDGAVTRNYDSGNAASSLIGDAGSTTDGEKISLEFRNIKLDGRTYSPLSSSWTVGGTSYTYNQGGTYTGSVFTKATLMNAFYYQNETTCKGIYNFNIADPIVTYGKEISETSSGRSQYWYYDTFNTGDYVWDRTKTGCGDASDNTGKSQTYFSAGYLPYVYVIQDNSTSSIDLRVNQGAVANADGCGTYGHPYVITKDNVDWFYRVAAYLNADTDIIVVVNKTALDAGKFVSADYHTGETENDVKLSYSSGTWTVTNGEYTIANQGELSKKVRRYLANAYYQFDTASGAITLEIGGSGGFYGLGAGSADVGNGSLAFAGVLIGSDPVRGTDITIDLNGASAKHCGGLVCFANGCVIKDLNIEFTGTYTVDIDDDFMNTIAYDFFGGAIGYVIGGDNIIENVYADFSGATVAVETNTYANLSSVGGYVGLVGGVISNKDKQGSAAFGDIGFTAGGGVVFRNMASAHGLSGVSYSSSVISTGSEYSSLAGAQNYLYWNPFVGRVYDGYACYDTMTSGSGASLAPTLNNTDKNYSIPTICNAGSSIEVSITAYSKTTPSEYSWTIKNEQGLWLLSSIVNSGAGVHEPSYETVDGVKVPASKNIVGPAANAPDMAYTFGKARSTRAKYDSVGQIISDDNKKANEIYNENAWSGVSAHNTNQQISYLVDKSGAGSIAGAATFDYSRLEGYNKLYPSQNYYVKYNFYISKDLNMDSCGNGFRGVGYSYSADGVSTVITREGMHIQLFRRCLPFEYFGSSEHAMDGSDTARTITMDMKKHEYKDETFHILGAGFMPTLLVQDVNNTTDIINSLSLSGNVQYSMWDYQEQEETVPGTSLHTAVGGLFGKVAYSKQPTYNITVHLNNVVLDDLTVSGGRYTGGFGGSAIPFDNGFASGVSYNGAKIFVFSECGYDDLHVSGNGYAGGVFGVATFRNVSENGSLMENCEFKNGVIKSDFSCPYVKFQAGTDEAENGIGGLFGVLTSGGKITITDSDMENVSVETENAYGCIGGICGVTLVNGAGYSFEVYGISIEGCTFGPKENSTRSAQKTVTSVGGLVGKSKNRCILMSRSETRENVIQGTTIRWGVNNGGIVGRIDDSSAVASFEYIRLEDNKIYVDYDTLKNQASPKHDGSYTGGLYGSNNWADVVTRHIVLNDNKIIGTCVGGLFGMFNKSVYTINASDITINGGIIACSWDTSRDARWAGASVGGIIGQATAGYVNFYDVYLENVSIGLLLDGSSNQCHSLDESFVDAAGEGNVGMYSNGGYKSYINENFLRTSAALVRAENRNIGYLAGYIGQIEGLLNTTGLYMHSDHHCWPYSSAYIRISSGSAPITDSSTTIIYADYSGIQTYTTATDWACVDINPHIGVPGGIDLYGNFIGNELINGNSHNIYSDTRSSVLAGNYWDCYFNAADETFTADETDYNLLEFLSTAHADGTDINGQLYLSTYKTEQTNSRVPDGVDFPVLVVHTEAKESLDGFFKGLIRVLTNTKTEKYSGIELITYSFDRNENEFVASGNNSMSYLGDVFDVTTSHNTNNDSFMLVRVKYQDPTSSEDNFMYLDIPVIVYKMMEFSVDIRLLAGTSYIPASYDGITSMVVAEHGDLFTARIEYNYMRDLDTWNGDLEHGVNLNWNYDKNLYLGPENLPVGTQFILVDGTKGGEAYYYTLASETNIIDFTSFRTGLSSGTGWKATPISEFLGLAVTDSSGDGWYDVWTDSDDESLKAISVDGIFYKYNDTNTGAKNITMPSGSLDSSDYLVSGERYYVTIRTPGSENTLLNELMSYGTSSIAEPLTSSASSAIATKYDKTNSYSTYRYLLTNTFTQVADIDTLNPIEDMTDQTGIEAELICEIPAITPENMADYEEFHGYTTGIINMYQEFTVSLSEYDAAGVSKSCFITANGINWTYKLIGPDGTEVATKAELDTLARQNGNILTSGALDSLYDELNESHNMSLLGTNSTVSLRYDTFDHLMNAFGKLGFKLVADAYLTYDDATKEAQFPPRNVSDSSDQAGIGVSAWSRIAYSEEALATTNFASGVSDDRHFFLPSDEDLTSDAVLQMNISDVQTLSGNGYEIESFDIESTGVYDYSLVDAARIDEAAEIRYTVTLLRKTGDSGRETPAYEEVENPATYFTAGSVSITRDGSEISGFTATYDFTPDAMATDSATVKCSPITGRPFEALGYRYGNYRIQMKAELLDGSGQVISSTIASDYIVYTNAAISTDFIS